MVQSTFTTNNKPLGVGFDSKSRPKSLMELTTMEVATLSATTISSVDLVTSSIESLDGGLTTIIIKGNVSAVAFIGASGTGASALVDLTDVDIPSLASISDQMLYVNGSVVSALPIDHEIFSDEYQGKNATLTEIAALALAANQYILKNSGGTLTVANIGSFGQSLVANTTAVGARNSLELGSLALSTTFAFGDLSDADDLTTGDINDIVYIKDSGGALGYISSSILVGESPSAHGALSELDALSAHNHYIDISGLHGSISAITASAEPEIGFHLTNLNYVTSVAATLQTLNVNLTSLSNATSSAGGVLYWDGDGQITGAPSLTAGLGVLNNASIAAIRTYLELGTLALESNLSVTGLTDVNDHNLATAGDLLYVSGGTPVTIAYKGVDEISHGSLADLNNDTHTIYSLVNGTRAFTSTPSSITAPTVGNHLVNKTWADAQLATKQPLNGLITDIANLKGTMVEGDLLYWNGTDFVRLPIGAAGESLHSNGTTVSWAATALP